MPCLQYSGHVFLNKECLKEIQLDWPSVKHAGSKNNYELLPKAKIN